MAKRLLLAAFLALLSGVATQASPYRVVLNYSRPYYYQKTLKFETSSRGITIGELKLLVQQKINVPPAHMHIFLAGEFMLDDQLLQTSAQHDESTIDIWIDEGGLLCVMW